MHIRSVLFITLIFANTSFSQDWSSYTSSNITIYSDRPSNTVTELLEEFEVFRYLALRMLGIPDQPDNNKLVIIIYDQDREFGAIRPEGAAGFFYNSMNGPRMVVGPYGRDVQAILFHEYVHYLLSEHTNVNYPRWYNEGLSDVLSSVRFSNDQIRVGMLPEVRASWLANERMLLVDDLIRIEPRVSNINSDNYDGRFYASAWVMVHYLQLGALVGDTELQSQNSEYLRRFNEGEDPREAFISSFGTTPEEMDSILRSYVRNGRYAVVNFPRFEYAGDIQVESMPKNEEAYLLASIAFDVGNQDMALSYLEETEQGQLAARNESLRAIIFNHADEIEFSEQAFQSAIESEIQDTIFFSNLAHSLWDSHLRNAEEGNLEMDMLNQVRAYASDAIALDDQNLEAYYLNARANESLNENEAALNNMIELYSRYPSHPIFNIYLSKLLALLGYYNESELVLRRTIAASHSLELRAKLGEIIEQLETENIDIELFDELLQ